MLFLSVIDTSSIQVNYTYTVTFISPASICYDNMYSILLFEGQSCPAQHDYLFFHHRYFPPKRVNPNDLTVCWPKTLGNHLLYVSVTFRLHSTKHVQVLKGDRTAAFPLKIFRNDSRTITTWLWQITHMQQEHKDSDQKSIKADSDNHKYLPDHKRR